MTGDSSRDATVTTQRCPYAAEHKTEKNVMLRQLPDGSKFCPVHGAIEEGMTSVHVYARSYGADEAKARSVFEAAHSHVGERPAESSCWLLREADAPVWFIVVADEGGTLEEFDWRGGEPYEVPADEAVGFVERRMRAIAGEIGGTRRRVPGGGLEVRDTLPEGVEVRITGGEWKVGNRNGEEL